MMSGAVKLGRSRNYLGAFVSQCHSTHNMTPLEKLEQTIKAAVEAKKYEKIPEFLSSLKSYPNPNPFSFFSTFPISLRIKTMDEMLQTFIPLRPRSMTESTYACLLLYVLQSSDPLPLALAVIQRTLRSGCVPAPQIYVLLSSAWLERRHKSYSVTDILLEMQSIGYTADCGTCNYLLSCLCAVDQLVEAVEVLNEMAKAGCFPNSRSYGTVISAMCRLRRTTEALDLMTEMVLEVGLFPDQGLILKMVSVLRADRELWRAADLVKLLENEGCTVGFESYEVVVKGCLEKGEYVLGGKVAVEMTKRGFIPHIRVRQKIIEGLYCVGELTLASTVRQRFKSLNS